MYDLSNNTTVIYDAEPEQVRAILSAGNYLLEPEEIRGGFTGLFFSSNGELQSDAYDMSGVFLFSTVADRSRPALTQDDMDFAYEMEAMRIQMAMEMESDD